jgi:hypothetical protein
MKLEADYACGVTGKRKIDESLLHLSCKYDKVGLPLLSQNL